MIIASIIIFGVIGWLLGAMLGSYLNHIGLKGLSLFVYIISYVYLCYMSFLLIVTIIH